jgi:predicted PurR-regulated permease PerM
VLFPIQLSRNVIIHSILYATFFMSNSMGILIVNLTGNRLSIAVSTCLMGVSVLCMIGWLVLMSREGEQKIMAIRHPVPVDESRLVAQLAEINATLLRARKQTSPEASGVRR